MSTILVVDDDYALISLLRDFLQSIGHVAIEAHDGETALELCRKVDVDAILLDYNMPGISGIETMKEIREIIPNVPVIMMTGYADIELAVEAMKLGAYEFIAKPIDLGFLKVVMEKAINHYGLLKRFEDISVSAQTAREINERLENMVKERTSELYSANEQLRNEITAHKQTEEALKEMEELEGKLRRRTRELEEAREAADSANRFKSQFLAYMSHDMRTPMNAVIGLTELVLGTDLSHDQRENLEIIKQSSEALINLLNDILDLSKIEAGKLELEEADFNIASALEIAIKPLAPRIREKGLELYTRISPEVPAELKGDLTRFRRIITNLVENAIKFTETGRLVLEVRTDQKCPEACVLHFLVSDTGIGIPEDKINKIFESFSQADISTTREYGGTGLGLTVSQQFVRLMDGDIWAESLPGRGSTFHFTARFGIGQKVKEEALSAKEDAPIHVPGKSLHILVAEDSPANQMLAVKVLDKHGHTSVIANNGKEALEALQKEHFDLVFMDINMPEMDGITATRAIRNSISSVFDPNIPIIAMTADTMSGDRERCLEAGMNGYVSKPLKIKVIPDIILTYVTAEKETVNPDLQEEVLALASALEMVDGDMELFEHICKFFREQTPFIIEEIREAIECNDADRVAFKAHSLVSAAGSVGAFILSKTAAELVRAARNKNTAVFGELRDRLAYETKRVLKEL